MPPPPGAVSSRLQAAERRDDAPETTMNDNEIYESIGAEWLDMAVPRCYVYSGRP